MNTRYLPLQTGDSENVKGRAILSIEKQRNSSNFFNQIIDINGSQLKEDLQDQLVRGKLVSPDIFIPSYLKVRKLEKEIPLLDLRDFAESESRDLIIIYLDDVKNGITEFISEQMITRYLMRYYEDIYSRVLENMCHHIFRHHWRYPYSSYYVALFRIMKIIILMLRTAKEKNLHELEFYKEEIKKYQQDLPILDISFISENLCSNAKEGQKIIDGMDALYLSLKKDFPCPYDENTFFYLDKNSSKWLEKGIANLYYRFFHHLFYENYEQAAILREEIKNFDFQSIKGYH